MPIKGIQNKYCFIISRDQPGILKVSEFPHSRRKEVAALKPGDTMQNIIHAFENGQEPLTILPIGLSSERERHLYTKIRQYVHDPTKCDNACPPPNATVNSSHCTTSGDTSVITDGDSTFAAGPSKMTTNTTELIHDQKPKRRKVSEIDT